MNLKEILQQVEKFSTNENTEDYEISKFFDEVGNKILSLGKLNHSEKEKIIKSLFDFLKRQQF